MPRNVTSPSVPLRLAAVSGFAPDPQGEAHYGTELFRRVAARNPGRVVVRVFAHAGATDDQSSLTLGLSVERVSGGDRLHATRREFRLARAVARFVPHIAHYEGIHTPLYGGLYGEATIPLLAAVRASGGSNVVSMHSTWMRTDLDALWASKGMPAPARRLLSAAYTAYLRALSRNADDFRIVTAGDGSGTVDAFLRDHCLNPSRVSIEPHPCSTEFVSQERKCVAKAAINAVGRTVIVAAGYVRPDKALHRLIDAARLLAGEHPKLLVIIAGQPVGAEGGAYARRLEAAAAGFGAVRLVFRYLPDAEMATLFDAADVVAVPYARVIGPSGPIHHALSRGKPVLASAVGHNLGLKDTVVLFDPHSGGLESALNVLLVTPGRLDELARRAREYAANHTWDDMADQYFARYEMLVSRGQV
jgi:glycosyltransferase involved in cell wall biosynthesis